MRQARRLQRWRWLTVSLLVVGYSGYYLCRSDMSVAIPLMIADWARHGANADAMRIRLGGIATLGVLAYGVGKFPAGFIADRYGGRWNFLFGMAGAVVFTAVCGAAGALPFFTLAWMANMLVQSQGWVGTVKATSRWFSYRSYGTVMAVISLSFLFGDAAVRQFMAVLLAQGWTWQGMFFTNSAVLGAVLLVCAWLIRESPREKGLPEAEADPEEALATGGSWRERLAPLAARPAFWIACGLSLGTTILRETFNLWTPTYFTQTTGMNAARAAGASALFPLLGGVSVVLCGWLSDRMGRRGRGLIMAVGLALAAAVLFAVAAGLGRGVAQETVLLVALIGFLTIGPYSFLAGAVALDLGGRAAGGAASGLIDGVGYLGGIVSGYTVARVSVAFGWGGAFALLGCIALASAVAALGFTRSFA